MTLYQFNALDEMEQLEAVWKGTLIGERKDEIYDINLYQIDGFYVEEYIHREYQARHRFRSFSNFELLDIYTNSIDVSGLIKGKNK